MMAASSALAKRVEQWSEIFVFEEGLEVERGILDDTGNLGNGADVTQAEILDIVALEKLAIERIIAGVVESDIAMVHHFYVAIRADIENDNF